MPLPFHFAFLSFPTFSCLQQPFLVKAMKGPVLGSSPLFYQAASFSLAQEPTWQRESGCQVQPLPSARPCWCCVSAVNQGSRVVFGSGGGQRCVSAMPPLSWG